MHVTSARLVKSCLCSLNERPGGNGGIQFRRRSDGLAARCLRTCREYGKSGPCSMLQDVKKLGTVRAARSLAQCRSAAQC